MSWKSDRVRHRYEHMRQGTKPRPRPSDDEILFSARFWGARDVDHPLSVPRTYAGLLEACGVYPVHGGPLAVRPLEKEIRKRYAAYGAKLAD